MTENNALPNPPVRVKYADRVGRTLPTGQKTWKTEEDERNEYEVADLIAKHYKIGVHSFGWYAPVDWWFTDENHCFAGVGELKCRSFKHTAHATTFLNYRKYLELTRHSMMGADEPAIFFLKFDDGIWWINVLDISLRKSIKIRGTREIVKSRNDREPTVLIPITDLHPLEGSPKLDVPPPRKFGPPPMRRPEPPIVEPAG